MIHVTLWDAKASAIASLQARPGSILFLENVKSKISRTADGSSYLEAVQHGDQDSTSPKVRLLKDSEGAARKLNQRAEQVTILNELDVNHLAQVVEPTAAAATATTPTASPTKKPKEKSPVKYRQLDDLSGFTASPPVPADSMAKATPVLSTSQIPRQMASSYTTFIDEVGAKISSLLEVRAYPSEHAKFSVRAHVSALLPQHSSSQRGRLVRVQCGACAAFTELGVFRGRRQCGACSGRDTCNRWIFVFGLLLDDGECDLPVIVAAEDAEHFLGFSAAEFAEGNEEDTLHRVIKQIELLREDRQEHLFCLQSYRVSAEEDSTCIRYRLIQTRMIGK